MAADVMVNGNQVQKQGAYVAQAFGAQREMLTKVRAALSPPYVPTHARRDSRYCSGVVSYAAATRCPLPPRDRTSSPHVPASCQRCFSRPGLASCELEASNQL
eukprot:3371014-Rhodomonas_salina.1